VSAVSLPANVKVATLLVLGSAGLSVMDVSGACVSTDQLYVAELWSLLPAASIARTAKLWAPSANPA
jgi:hypothetical protein